MHQSNWLDSTMWQQQRTMFVHMLQGDPTLRAIVYLGGVEAILAATQQIYPRDADWARTATVLTTTPLVVLWTRGFVSLREENHARWLGRPSKPVLWQAAMGTVLGTGVFLAVIGIAAARGWVAFPAWGWETTTPAQLARGVALTTLRHVAVCVNEELVFRGYGLDTATAAFGRPVAVLGLVVLFAAGHGSRVQVLIGQSALGLALTFLRLRSDSLWVPIGYHFGWNMVQTAVLGPPDALPSLRPMQVQGPELWIGRPGYPVPGLFMMIVNLAIALIAGLSWWRQTRTARNLNHQRRLRSHRARTISQ